MKISFAIAGIVIAAVGLLIGYSFYWHASNTTLEKIDHYLSEKSDVEYVTYESGNIFKLATKKNPTAEDYTEVTVDAFLQKIAETNGTSNAKTPAMVSNITLYFAKNELDIYGRSSLLLVTIEYNETPKETLQTLQLYLKSVFPTSETTKFTDVNFIGFSDLSGTDYSKQFENLHSEIQTMIESPFYKYFNFWKMLLKAITNK